VSIDSEWIIASLTNCKVYVFSARTGAHVRNLVGHSQGVWALHLVSKGGRADKAPCSEECETEDADDQMLDGAGSGSGYATPQPQPSPRAGLMNGFGLGFGLSSNSTHPRVDQPPTASQSYSHISPPVSPDPHARAPNTLNVSTSSMRTDSRPSSRGKKVKRPNNLPPLPKGLYLKQSDVCNASYGWGQEGAYALSGSCDRELRVWDVRSG
jgi:F-box and WD-40 domain protein CDC4